MNNNIGHPAYPAYYATTPQTSPAPATTAARPLTAPAVVQEAHSGPSQGMAARDASRAAANHPALRAAYVQHDARLQHVAYLREMMQRDPQTITDAYELHNQARAAWQRGDISETDYLERSRYLGAWEARARRSAHDFSLPSESDAFIARREDSDDDEERFAHLPR